MPETEIGASMKKKILEREDVDLTRPYEKCLTYGPERLSDAELLAVILRVGSQKEDAVGLARRILALAKDGSGLLGLLHLSVQDLMEVPGIGEVKAMQLKCIAELSKRISTQHAEEELDFSDPKTIAHYYMERIRHEEQEVLICVMLNNRLKKICDVLISKGTVNSSLVSTRDIFIAAAKSRAVRIVLLHNHPSGDPTPSKEDLQVTRKAEEAGKLLDIPLLDHIVIGDRSYVSFRECGLLPTEDG
jgi:DNA repair protein RadC